MAMQQSDELGEVASILFKQVKELGIHPWSDAVLISGRRGMMRISTGSQVHPEGS